MHPKTPHPQPLSQGERGEQEDSDFTADRYICGCYPDFRYFMNSIVPLTVSLLCGFWLVMTALIASQNPTPVSLYFLSLRSVPIPLGLVVTLVGLGGLVGTSLFLVLWNQLSRE